MASAILGGQPLLHLGTFGVDINEASELAQSGDLALSARDVADVSDPGERHEVVFAAAPDLDVLDQDQLVVTEVEDSGQDLLRILPQATEHFGVRSCDALWGLAQALPIRILTDSDQDLAYGGYDP